MSTSVAMRAAIVGIGANLLLLVVKGVAAWGSDSLTVFSETMNSLSDSVAAIVILLCVRWAWMSPDTSHPFGHRRAEPIAGLLVAIFTGILGFEACRAGAVSLWQNKLPENIGWYPVAALCLTAFIKAAMAVYFYRRARELGSPALRAAAVDCRNDVLLACQGAAGVLVARYELPLLDTVTGLVVGVYILYSAYRIMMDNIDYLMGKAPDDDVISDIRAAAERASGVLGVENIKGHYVGTFVHVELEVGVDGSLTTTDSHDVAEATREAVEKLDIVNRAFVHISPVPLPPPHQSSTACPE